MQADPWLDKEAAFSGDAIEVGEMPYFQADKPVVAYAYIHSQKTAAVSLVHNACVKAEIRPHPSGTNIPANTYFKCL